jgi:magnesium transporter
MSANPTQIEMLRKLLRHGATDRVVRILDRFRPAEMADLYTFLSPAEQKQLTGVLFDHKLAAATLREVPEYILAELLENLPAERVGQILNRVPANDAFFMVGSLSDERVEEVLGHVAPLKRERIEHLRAYPEDSAGQLMTSEMIRLREETTADQAIEMIRAMSPTLEFIFYVYVVNEAGTFLGVVPLRRLIAAGPTTLIKELMVPDPIAVQATDDQERVADVTARYDLLAVPVVDDNFKLLGVITVDDVLDVLQEEATEDMYLMQGLSEEDRVYAPMSFSVKKRFPWMVLNLATAFFSAYVVGLFEASISQVVVLAAFLPVVAGMGGNGGTQTLTVITRGIALGELDASEAVPAILKQVGIGIIVGAGVGLLTGVIAWMWKGMPYLGLVLFLAMLANMSIAGLAGAAIPLVLKSLRMDPAMGSGVLVTTFTDVTGFLAFLGLATIFIEYMV